MTVRGEVGAWLDGVAVPFLGDDCLTFPFHRNAQGYGHISARTYGAGLAHVYVAQVVLGLKPDGMECCHTCGKGHEGCVNPRHLYWGTRAQNVEDRKRHGAFVPPPEKRGSSNGNSTLSEAEVRRIKGSRALGVDLATAFNVSPSTISAIRHGRLWAWL